MNPSSKIITAVLTMLVLASTAVVRADHKSKSSVPASPRDTSEPMRRRATEQAFGLARGRPPVRRPLKEITRRFVTRADGLPQRPIPLERRPHFVTVKDDWPATPRRMARALNSGMAPGDRWEVRRVLANEPTTAVQRAVQPDQQRHQAITPFFVTAVVAAWAARRLWDAQARHRRDSIHAVFTTPRNEVCHPTIYEHRRRRKRRCRCLFS